MKLRILAAFALLCLLLSLLMGCHTEGTPSDTGAEGETTASLTDTEAADTAGTTDAPETEIPVSFPPYEDGDVVLRFVLTSDVHITSSSPMNQASRRLRKLINLSYAYAKGQPYTELDAVVVVGDLVDNGRAKEYTAFNKIMEEEIREGTELLTVIGNHEYFDGTSQDYRDNVNSDFHVNMEIKGYRFIGLSCQDGYGRVNEEDIAFLRQAVTDAVTADPEKPIITFQHHPVQNTVYMSVSSADYSPASAQLKEIYSLSSRIVNFSGHTHAPVNHPRAIWQGGYTAFGNGTTTYICHETELLQPAECNTTLYGDADQFCIVEITADHVVRILPMNMMTEDFFRMPGTEEQLLYEIDVNAPDSWEHTALNRATSKAPAFPEDAVITVNEAASGPDTRITFPQATDDECVYSYSVLCVGSDGSHTSSLYTSGYYVEPMPERLTINLRDSLKKDVAYTVTVTPIDGFGNEGEPLTVTITP